MPSKSLEAYRKELEAKHWSKSEIEQALKAFQYADKNIPYKHATFNQMVYFLALVMSLVGNFAITVMLIPFIVLAEGIYLYPGLFIISLAFGGLFDLIVYDIEKISEAPRFKQGLFLFAIAVINIWLIIELSGYMGELVGLVRDISVPIITGAVYVSGFMIPHLISRKTKLIEQLA